MRWIDFEDKLPTDKDIPGWTPWSETKWSKWLEDSEEYLTEARRLHALGQTAERNEYIKSKSAHWGKLKDWLRALSHGKCWFSDTKDKYSHYDVEHFRPKSEALNLDGTSRDGYWWLAFEYSNYRICGNVGNRKKGGWFPLREKSLCSTYDCQCEESETRYFIDPTDPEDVNLIAFNEEGNVVAAPSAEPWEAERVEQSRKRLKLNEHDDLPEARREVWQKMSRLIERYLQAKSRCGSNRNPGAEGKLREYVREMKAMLRPDVELSSVAKWCILFRNDQRLLKLVA
jgi:uncharacterized protein (TIGR02646 family)